MVKVSNKVKYETPAYYSDFEPLINTRFLINIDDLSDRPKIDPSLIENESETKLKEGDIVFIGNCFAKLIQKGGNKCSTSDACYEYCLNSRFSGKIKVNYGFTKSFVFELCYNSNFVTLG